ncbi:MAG: BMP family ABC transporter substrate-binding protein [Spirochaetota bacterium]
MIAIGDACDFGAIKAAEEKGAYVIGWVGDFNSLSPMVVICSGVQSVPMLITSQGEAVNAGTWKAEHKEFGVKDGYQFMGTWSPVVSEELKKEILADQEKIIKGELVINFPAE